MSPEFVQIPPQDVLDVKRLQDECKEDRPLVVLEGSLREGSRVVSRTAREVIEATSLHGVEFAAEHRVVGDELVDGSLGRNAGGIRRLRRRSQSYTRKGLRPVRTYKTETWGR